MNHFLDIITNDLIFAVVLPWGMVDLLYLVVCVVRGPGSERSFTVEGVDRHFPSVHNATVKD